MDKRVRVLLKHFIKAVAEIYGLDEIGAIRKIARFINFNQPADITKLLYSVVKEEESD